MPSCSLSSSHPISSASHPIISDAFNYLRIFGLSSIFCIENASEIIGTS
jgi:hypothetical protein